jgi:uncharacterized membrane protein (UPF0127 family)
VALLVKGGQTVAVIALASSRASRRRGLLGCDGLEGALLLEPCRSVHTVGMRFPIDVAHCRGSAAAGLEIICVRTMAVRRLGRPHLLSRCVIEAEKGAFARWGLSAGDRLEIR